MLHISTKLKIILFILALNFSGKAQDLPFVLESGISDGLIKFGGGKSLWADVNNDGQPDLILSGYVPSVPSNLTIVYINGAGNSYSSNPILNYGSAYFGDLQAGDVDNDGDLDLIITGGGATSLLLNEDGLFTLDAENVFPALVYSTSQFEDIDNDGDLDLLLMGLQVPEEKLFTRIYVNNPLGTFKADETQILASLAAGDAAFGDYDGDGDMDLALSGQSAETTSRVTKIYKNEPTGRLIEDTNQSLTGLKASSLDWSDIDNDGDLDLITSGWDGNTDGIPVTIIYRNEPAGTLLPYNSNISFGTGYGSISSGDLDGDGDVDLLISGADSLDAMAENYLKLQAKIFVNDGNGYFSEGGSFPDILHSSMGEFNQDGKPEIFLNGFTDVALTDSVISLFYENNAAGSFVEPDPPGNLSSFVVGNRIILSWNDGADDKSPVEGLNYTMRMGTSSQGHDIFSGVVSDGKSNLGHHLNKIFMEKSHGKYYWSIKSIDQQFQTSDWSREDTLDVSRLVESIQSLSGIRFNTASWIDYNGDDRLDLAMTGYSSVLKDTSMFLFENDLSGFLTQDVTHNIRSAWGATMAWGDYDNDGYLDFVLSGISGGGPATYLYRWDSDLQTFLLISNSGLPDLWGGSQIAEWGDYNLDGRLDLLIGGQNSENKWELNLYENTADNLFKKDTLQNIEALISLTLAFNDFNKDGYLDFAAGGVDSLGNSVLLFYESDSTGIFILSDSVAGEGPAVGSMDWGDYNNDGYADLAIAGLYSSGLKLKIFENIEGRFSVSAATELEGGFYYGSLDWGDYDNDGDLDLALSGNTTVTDIEFTGEDPITRIWINNAGNFSAYESLDGAGTGTVLWGDYDADGDLDLLVSGSGLEGDDFTKVYDNLEGVLNQNEAPQAPFGLFEEVNLNAVKFFWSAGLDNINPLNGKTDSEALSYSLLVYHEEGEGLALSGSIPAGDGRHGTALSKSIYNLSDGSYYWQVQAFDHSHAPSDWSFKSSFYIDTTAPEIDTLIANFYPNNSVFIVIKFEEDFAMDVMQSLDVKVTHPNNVYPDTMIVAEQSYSGKVWTGTFTLPPEYPGQFIKINISQGQDLRGNLMDSTIVFRSPAKILASKGGTIISDDGKATLHLSPNSLAEDVVVEIKAAGLIDTALIDSGWVQFGQIYEISPDSLLLAKPAVLRIYTEISAEDLILYDNYSIGRVQGDSLIKIMGGSIYSENEEDFITSSIDSLGTFGIFIPLGLDTFEDKGLFSLSCQPRVFSPAGTVFSKKTHILFSLEKNYNVSVAIYNPAGRLKRTIIKNRDMFKGQNIVEWDGRDQLGDIVTSGIYIAVIEAGNNKKAITVGVVNQ